ncbi:MAG: hypothetical protein LBN36_04545 [Clostridiales Family XIII bacterium]|jgi:hypothetical protein|nr:hypothetical protein [Clostridiales Family XIII bacterium]
MSDNILEAEFETVELFGKTALFTNSRIDRDSVPEGYFVYDLRHGDSGNPVAVEPFVGANHAGTVIMTEPLKFKKADEQYRRIGRGLNFIGENVSFEEFAAEYGQEQSGPAMEMS